mgnify:CR=1 FL=1
MNDKKALLLRLGISLYQLGIKVETARQRMRDLVNSSVPYESEEMQTALQELWALDSQWRSLEAQYLELRKEITAYSSYDKYDN